MPQAAARQQDSMSTHRTNPIARDIQNVVTEAQDLLKTVQNEGEASLTTSRRRCGRSSTSRAADARASCRRRCRTAPRPPWTRPTTYVRANPWRAVGISAGVGALIGFLASRR